MSSADKTRASELAVVVAAVLIVAVLFAGSLLSLLNLLLIYVAPLVILGVIVYFLFFGGNDQRKRLSPEEQKGVDRVLGRRTPRTIKASKHKPRTRSTSARRFLTGPRSAGRLRRDS